MNSYLKGLYSKDDFFILDKPGVLLFGRSNIGKSSLINSIFNQKIARTSQTPGKTVAVHFFEFNNLYLIDLPGYGYAKRSKVDINKFSELTNDFLSFIKNENILVLLLVDAKVSLQKADYFAINYLEQNDINYFFVLTKIDKANQKMLYQTKKDLLEFKALKIVETSSLKKRGFQKLEKEINNFFKGDNSE